VYVLKQGTEEYDIQIRTETPAEQTERNLGDLKKLTVKGRNDAQFELQNISTFSITEGAPTIKRIKPGQNNLR